MRSSVLPFVLCGALAAACGSNDATTSDGVEQDQDRATKSDGGAKKDATSSKPAPDSGKKPAMMTGSDDPPNTCDKLQLVARPQSPEILIVQDRSGSMVGLGDARNAGKNRWQPSVNALKKLTSELTDTVAFGLMLFPAPGGNALEGLLGGSSCTPGKIDVEVATGTADEIARVLDRSRPDVGATPTAATLAAAKTALDTGPCADCKPVPKYVLLVTDGQPTCGASGSSTTAPEDITAANDAIDDLSMAGIKTFVIGYDTASDPDAAAAMDGFAMHGGTDHYLPVEDEATLLAELTRIAGSLVPCEFDLSSEIEDPSFVRVEIDGTTYEYGTDWDVKDRTIVLKVEGGACPRLRDAKVHDLKITRECKPVMVI